MARVKDSYYFETFVECADYSLQAAKLLKEIMTDYDSTMIGENTKKNFYGIFLGVNYGKS